MRLRPEAVPDFAAADIERPQRGYRRGAFLDPAHARSFEPFADDLAPRLGGAASYVPTFLPVGWVVGAVAIVLEIPDQLA